MLHPSEDLSVHWQLNFPTKSRSPQIDITLYLLQTIRSMGYRVLFIRVDEDGAFARSSEFCQMIVEENIVLQTTGGGTLKTTEWLKDKTILMSTLYNRLLAP